MQLYMKLLKGYQSIFIYWSILQNIRSPAITVKLDSLKYDINICPYYAMDKFHILKNLIEISLIGLVSVNLN